MRKMTNRAPKDVFSRKTSFLESFRGASVGTKVPHSAVGIGSVRTWPFFEPFWGFLGSLCGPFRYCCFWLFGVMYGSKLNIYEALSMAQFGAKFVVFGFILDK